MKMAERERERGRRGRLLRVRVRVDGRGITGKRSHGFGARNAESREYTELPTLPPPRYRVGAAG